jgi:hypothetical protein
MPDAVICPEELEVNDVVASPNGPEVVAYPAALTLAVFAVSEPDVMYCPTLPLERLRKSPRVAVTLFATVTSFVFKSPEYP